MVNPVMNPAVQGVVESVAVAAAPEPAESIIVTIGAEPNPTPAVLRVILVMTPPNTVAEAVAPAPPPLMITVGFT